MKRKVSQIGPSTLMVSLPAKWVKKYGVKKGDEVELSEENNRLILSTEKYERTLKKEIDTNSIGLFISNHLSTLYHLGYDELLIKYTNYNVYKIIKDRLPDCIGFEIIEQSENHILIKNISGNFDDSVGTYDTVQKRIFLLLLELAEGLEKAIENKDYSKIRRLRELERMNNKLTGFCLRILNKIGYSIPKKTNSAYVFMEDLEELADEYKHICDIIYKNPKINFANSLKEYIKIVNNYLNNFHLAFYNVDNDKIAHLIKKRFKLLEKGYSLLKKSRQDETIVLHHLINIVTKIYECLGVYFEIIL